MVSLVATHKSDLYPIRISTIDIKKVIKKPIKKIIGIFKSKIKKDHMLSNISDKPEGYEMLESFALRENNKGLESELVLLKSCAKHVRNIPRNSSRPGKYTIYNKVTEYFETTDQKCNGKEDLGDLGYIWKSNNSKGTRIPLYLCSDAYYKDSITTTNKVHCSTPNSAKEIGFVEKAIRTKDVSMVLLPSEPSPPNWLNQLVRCENPDGSEYMDITDSMITCKGTREAIGLIRSWNYVNVRKLFKCSYKQNGTNYYYNSTNCLKLGGQDPVLLGYYHIRPYKDTPWDYVTAENILSFGDF